MAVTNGRRADGKFTHGNTCALGNGVSRRVLKLRARLLKSVSPEDFDRVFRKLTSLAADGDMTAIRTYLEYTVGRPTQALTLAGPAGEPLGSNVDRLQEAILEALKPFPQARLAVALRLQGLPDAKRTGQNN